MFLTIVIISLWLLFASLTSFLAKMRGLDPIAWFYYGYFLGIIGPFAALLLPDTRPVEEPVPAGPVRRSLSMNDLQNKDWYFLDDDHNQYGPMSFDQLSQSLKKGKVGMHNYIWNEDLEDWQSLQNLEDYHEFLDTNKT